MEDFAKLEEGLIPSQLWRLLQVPCSVAHRNIPGEIIALNVCGKREESS